MPKSIHWLIPLCIASFLWAFQFGASSALASLWMRQAGCSDAAIGLNTGTYYLGIALAAVTLPWLLRKLGSHVLLLGMLASATTAAAFPWGGGQLGWLAIRIVNGLAAALSLIPLETYVNRTSAPARRALNFGAYAFCIALGMALGNLVAIPMAPSQPRLAFLLSGAAAVLASTVVALWRPTFLDDADNVRTHTPLHVKRNFLAYGSGWSQGFMEGCMIAFLPNYLLWSVALLPETVSWLMSGLMMGVLLAQAPVAWLADKLGRTQVLAGCNLVSIVGIGCLMWPGGVAWLAFWLFTVGACSGALYPLGLALLGERTSPEGMSRAGSWFLAINSLGSVTGPIVAGEMMKQYGASSLFITGGVAISLVLGTWIVLAFIRRPGDNSSRRTDSIEERPEKRKAA